ncbi:terminase small subunit [Alteromonas phage ZP6]|uniref:terminase small subunit n=1 Tax=Alteromonas phage ZP6 TaxID=2492447 RepID=UPI000FF8D63B|nr:terminase small subunit [Alteromonas phage ZP6]QYK70228.1 terminase small subunit [Alteromonas phage ZP6]
MSNSNELIELSSKEFSEKLAHNEANGWPDLAPDEKAFLANYAQTYSIKEAAEGINSIGAQRGGKLLRNPLAVAFLNQIQDVLASRSVITRDFVNVQWMNLLPKVMGEEEVAMVDREGCGFFGKKFDAAAATKVLTELSKSTNFYADGSGQSASVNISIDLGALGIQEKGVTIEGEKS